MSVTVNKLIENLENHRESKKVYSITPRQCGLILDELKRLQETITQLQLNEAV